LASAPEDKIDMMNFNFGNDERPQSLVSGTPLGPGSGPGIEDQLVLDDQKIKEEALKIKQGFEKN
jgi:hypothetical protein